MSPEVIERKLAMLKAYRQDLGAYDDAGSIHADHYAVERLIQLIVECMCDVLSRWLAMKGLAHPDSYTQLFAEAAERKALSAELAGRLTNAAKMRNLLVHAYERIDLAIVAKSVPQLLTDADEFIRQVEQDLTAEG